MVVAGHFHLEGKTTSSNAAFFLGFKAYHCVFLLSVICKTGGYFFTPEFIRCRCRVKTNVLETCDVSLFQIMALLYYQ